MERNVKALIISSHPDDEVLGCGGTIRKLTNEGFDVYVLILTSKIEKYLKECCLNAHKVLGTKKIFFENFPNQLLDSVPIIKINNVIENYLSKLKPSIVFTHHFGDVNMDHKVVFNATSVAVRPLYPLIVKKLYSYFVASSTEWNVNTENVFIPNTFINIEDSLDKKIKAMKCYKTEYRKHPHPRSAESIKSYAHYWGGMAGFKFAEPFVLLREIIL
ncbi:MAG: PIG-L deacetylase family protein [Candidatus Firestonebacteria bacterium]